MNRKKPKSGKGERRKAIKPVEAWAFQNKKDGRVHWKTYADRESIEVAHDNPFWKPVRVLIVEPRFYRIVPLNPKRKAK